MAVRVGGPSSPPDPSRTFSRAGPRLLRARSLSGTTHSVYKWIWKCVKMSLHNVFHAIRTTAIHSNGNSAMDVKCQIIRLLANRCAFGRPIHLSRLRLAVPVDNSRFTDVDEAVEELCSEEPFVCESQGDVLLVVTEKADLVRYVRENCDSEVFRVLRRRLE